MSVLNKINDFITDSSEQALKVVEEGTALLMGNMDVNDPSNDSSASASANAYANAPSADMDMGDDIFVDEETMDGFDDEDMMNADSPLNGIAEGVLGDIMKNQAAPKSIGENILAFRSAITWGEPFILSILAFHFALLIAAFFVTRKGGMWSRFTVMGIILIVVRSAERLNDYGAQNWESIATQNYFDKRGVFVSLMLSAPLLLISVFMLLAFMREAVGLLVEVKKHELRAKAKAGGKDAKKQSRGKKNKKQD